jgi:hypothetical protein
LEIPVVELDAAPLYRIAVLWRKHRFLFLFTTASRICSTLCGRFESTTIVLMQANITPYNHALVRTLSWVAFGSRALECGLTNVLPSDARERI